MIRSKYLMQIVILLLFFHLCGLRNTVAHEGHDHAHDAAQVIIERSTFTHLKSILSIYHEVYDSLTKRQLNHVPALAQILLDTAGNGIEAIALENQQKLIPHNYHHLK